MSGWDTWWGETGVRGGIRGKERKRETLASVLGETMDRRAQVGYMVRNARSADVVFDGLENNCS